MQELTTTFFRARDENIPLERDKLQGEECGKEQGRMDCAGS